MNSILHELQTQIGFDGVFYAEQFFISANRGVANFGRYFAKCRLLVDQRDLTWVSSSFLSLGILEDIEHTLIPILLN